MTAESRRLLRLDQDRQEWLELWARSGREPFAHPDYSAAFCPGDGEAVALVLLGPGQEFALLPLVLRPLTEFGSDGYDAISPYGYGGPFFSPDFPSARFRSQLRDWARDERICSVFVRLSLHKQLTSTGADASLGQVLTHNDNVVVDLQRDVDTIWMSYEHKVRKNVNKARRAGCVVRRDDGITDVDGFARVYASTMRRRAAAQWYYFDAEMLQRLTEALSGSCSVFSVLDGTGRLVSVELVLESDERLYSFLGGTLEEAFPMTPNDLLKHEVVLHGVHSGRREFVLGGGPVRGDGIFRYKKSFDPNGVVPFQALHLIGDVQLYDDLTRRRSRLSSQPPAGLFFPQYRAPLGGPEG